MKVVSASFADPYLLIRRDNSSIMILKADERGEIDELDRGEMIINKSWVSGCLYRAAASDDSTLVCLLGAGGGLKVRRTLAFLSIATNDLCTDLQPSRSNYTNLLSRKSQLSFTGSNSRRDTSENCCARRARRNSFDRSWRCSRKISSSCCKR